MCCHIDDLMEDYDGNISVIMDSECITADGDFSYVYRDTVDTNRCWVCGKYWSEDLRFGNSGDCLEPLPRLINANLNVYQESCLSPKCLRLHQFVMREMNIELAMADVLKIHYSLPRCAIYDLHNRDNCILIIFRYVDFKARLEARLHDYRLFGYVRWLWRHVNKMRLIGKKNNQIFSGEYKTFAGKKNYHFNDITINNILSNMGGHYSPGRLGISKRSKDKYEGRNARCLSSRDYVSNGVIVHESHR